MEFRIAWQKQLTIDTCWPLVIKPGRSNWPRRNNGKKPLQEDARKRHEFGPQQSPALTQKAGKRRNRPLLSPAWWRRRSSFYKLPPIGYVCAANTTNSQSEVQFNDAAEAEKRSLTRVTEDRDSPHKTQPRILQP